MRGILSPLPVGCRPTRYTPSSLGSVSGTLGSALIERRPKRKSKVKLAQTKYDKKSTKGRKPAPKFQKLVVIDYMGPDVPRSFTFKESMVLLRGMLPEVAVDASEHEVRTHIRDTVKNAENSFRACLLSDFEYTEAHGKTCVSLLVSQTLSGQEEQLRS